LIESWKENLSSNWTIILDLNEQMTFEDACCCDERFVNVELNEQEMNQICGLNSKYEIQLSSLIDCLNILSSTNTISTSIESIQSLLKMFLVCFVVDSSHTKFEILN
jgi:hypothetical protein